MPSKLRRLRVNPSGTLLLTTLVFAASSWLTLSGGNAVFCERLAPLGVTAALAALLLALAFRQLSRTAGAQQDHARGILGCALLLASVALFLDARFLAQYRAPCAAVQKQLQDFKQQRAP